MSGWIDTHCHLHRAEFDVDRDAVIRRAVEAGALALLDPATDLASNRTVVELARKHPEVYAALGIHPHDAREVTDESLAELGAQRSRLRARLVDWSSMFANISAPGTPSMGERNVLALRGALSRP